MKFRDRTHAGQLLATRLQNYRGKEAIVLALPRGGVPVAFEVAKFLRAPLDVLLVRKLGDPLNPEFALGAVCEDADPIWISAMLSRRGLAPDDLGRTLLMERKKIRHQRDVFRAGNPLPPLARKTVIVVDDGLATGATLSAAVGYLKDKGAARIVAAVPVASSSSAFKIKRRVDEFVAIDERENLTSVGQWYEDFTQTTDQEVVRCLNESKRQTSPESFA